MLTHSEENHLKAIYALTPTGGGEVSTSDIAARLETKASSVTDMIQKLAEKGLVNYKKYKGVVLSPDGQNMAVQIVRKHRLWEVFLSEKLGFGWDQVHDIAEQLEHIQSEALTNRLDEFLGHPKYDPHGDPIPDQKGKIYTRKSHSISQLKAGAKGVITGVRDSSASFLQYLDKQKLVLGTNIEVCEIFEYDRSVKLKVNSGEVTISNEASQNIKVQLLEQ